MSGRRVLYVAHPVSPTVEECEVVGKIVKAEILNDAIQRRALGVPDDFASRTITATAMHVNVRRAMQLLTWLRRSFPETTFIAPWIASILAGDDDSNPLQREAGLVDAVETVRRSDGIVLGGPRMGSGMLRERDAQHKATGFAVYDMVGWGDIPTINAQMLTGRYSGVPFHDWHKAYAAERLKALEAWGNA